MHQDFFNWVEATRRSHYCHIKYRKASFAHAQIYVLSTICGRRHQPSGIVDWMRQWWAMGVGVHGEEYAAGRKAMLRRAIAQWEKCGTDCLVEEGVNR